MKALVHVLIVAASCLFANHREVAGEFVILDQLVSNTTSNIIPGQSLTTPAGGPWNNLQFNWFDDLGAPRAFGTLFILTQEYTLGPFALSNATPGFVTAALPNIAGTDYVPPSPIIELQPSTTYYFYANAVPPGPIKIATNNPLTLGSAYEASSSFAAVPDNDLAFSLTGVVVPEPSAFLLTALALLGLFAHRHRRA